MYQYCTKHKIRKDRLLTSEACPQGIHVQKMCRRLVLRDESPEPTAKAL